MSSKSQDAFKGKKILIIHYRVGKTDGVSLQIGGWKQILERGGAEVGLCAGPVSEGADFVIEALEQHLNPDIYAIDEAAFAARNIFKNEEEFIKAVRGQEEILKPEFDKVLEKFKPDHIIISNIFSVGEHLPAAGALIAVLDRQQIPTIAVNHDFYWENKRYDRPAYPFVEKQLEQFFPPQRPWLKHCCINSVAREELMRRKGIKATVFHDAFDFEQSPWKKDEFNRDLLDGWDIGVNDIIVLQATRIVRRKNIEIAIDLVKALGDKRFLAELESKGLYDGRVFSAKKNRIVFVATAYAEKRHQRYFKSLVAYAGKKGIRACLIGDRIGAVRAEKDEGKQYALWDAYPFADLITYPSEEEGFGNQLLEAVFAKKPVAVFEYPVFKADIKPKGFDVVSLGDRVLCDKEGWCRVPKEKLQKAAEELVEILTDGSRYKAVVEKNFKLGKKYFSFEVAAKILAKLLS